MKRKFRFNCDDVNSPLVVPGQALHVLGHTKVFTFWPPSTVATPSHFPWLFQVAQQEEQTDWSLIVSLSSQPACKWGRGERVDGKWMG